MKILAIIVLLCTVTLTWARHREYDEDARCTSRIPHGRIERRCSRRPGNQCSYKCNDGYTKTQDIVTCLRNGRWDTPETPSGTIYTLCVKPGCLRGEPYRDQYGEVFCGRGPTRQECPDGYYCDIAPDDSHAYCCPITSTTAPSTTKTSTTTPSTTTPSETTPSTTTPSTTTESPPSTTTPDPKTTTNGEETPPSSTTPDPETTTNGEVSLPTTTTPAPDTTTNGEVIVNKCDRPDRSIWWADGSVQCELLLDFPKAWIFAPKSPTSQGPADQNYWCNIYYPSLVNCCQTCKLLRKQGLID